MYSNLVYEEKEIRDIQLLLKNLKEKKDIKNCNTYYLIKNLT